MYVIRAIYGDRGHMEQLESFYDNVLTGLYDEELLPDKETFLGVNDTEERLNNKYCLLAMAGNKPIGGVTAEYFSECNSCIIEFLQTTLEYESVQEELLYRMVELLHQLHRKARHIYIELVPNAANLGDGFYYKWCKRIDMKYITPPVTLDADPGQGLMLCLVDELVDTVASSDVVSFISEYFNASFCGKNVAKYIPNIHGELRVLNI